MIECKYYYKDEFGQETETKKSYTDTVLEDSMDIEVMMDVFKRHLRNCGFTEEYIKEQAKKHFM